MIYCKKVALELFPFDSFDLASLLKITEFDESDQL